MHATLMIAVVSGIAGLVTLGLILKRYGSDCIP